MQDLLMLWDAIFADGIGFDLVDYIFVAMMLYIRDLCKSPFAFLGNCFHFYVSADFLQITREVFHAMFCVVAIQNSF